jgi:hypothetical protein
MELYQKRAPVGERFPPLLLDSIVLRARSLAGLASGTVIQNQATVDFDYVDEPERKVAGVDCSWYDQTYSWRYFRWPRFPQSFRCRI